MNQNYQWKGKRRHPESNGEAPEGSGLKPDAIPLCDDGMKIELIYKF